MTTHGHAAGKMTRVYRIWLGMKNRCNNKKNSSYSKYGKRGIKVCKRWENSFKFFLRDMGEPPSKLHTLDRINNYKGYSANNCRWATRKEQNENKENNKFDQDTAKIVRYLYNRGFPITILRKVFNASNSTVWRVCTGKTYQEMKA